MTFLPEEMNSKKKLEKIISLDSLPFQLVSLLTFKTVIFKIFLPFLFNKIILLSRNMKGMLSAWKTLWIKVDYFTKNPHKSHFRELNLNLTFKDTKESLLSQIMMI